MLATNLGPSCNATETINKDLPKPTDFLWHNTDSGNLEKTSQLFKDFLNS